MELNCWSCSEIVIVGVTWGILECPHCGIEFAVNHTLNTTVKPLETYAREHLTGDGGSPETAHFYYGNHQIGEYPNNSNKVEEINRYLDHVRA